MLDSICRFFVTGFYSGLSRSAPGTCGSVAAFLMALVAGYLFPAENPWSILCLLAVLSTAVGVLGVSRLYSSGLYVSEDPQEVVIDEFAGFYLTALFGTGSVLSLFMAFVLFRCFDILKPFPINRLETLPGAIGIMADDLGAGVFAGAILVILHGYLGIL